MFALTWFFFAILAKISVIRWRHGQCEALTLLCNQKEMTSCFPFLHQWPFAFYNHDHIEECDRSAEVMFLYLIIGITIFLFVYFEFLMFTCLSILASYRDERVRILGSLVELEGMERSKALEAMFKKYKFVKKQYPDTDTMISKDAIAKGTVWNPFREGSNLRKRRIADEEMAIIF
ncbi:hypothetical protein SBOR_7370 [Sclerotinia borealis F-4128]|uniref:Uncharacterized protein n=1 Tax=Sclerotinia borealis (strain F-4128) TaxID=1432307 RepID=W9CBL9_SCLBF|nr:hypothetical protein SBOR_7370 [Sclerotinia borealis F-4128]